MFDSQNAWLSQPCFGDIQYREGQKTFPTCVQVHVRFCDSWWLTLFSKELDSKGQFDYEDKRIGFYIL